ncbi:MAG: HigA family addiction module antidote protein [Acidobacteriia bacterium]|nr:HigA family addiction module antidote protein [Terriglobia bacterium]
MGGRFRVPTNRISAIVDGKRVITVDTAMRMARYFGTSALDWWNLQAACDLARGRRAGDSATH